jgi:hypothetical protein
MSIYACPNYPVCETYLNIVNDENIREDVNEDNETILGPCKVKCDPVTGKRTILELEHEVSVCWSCKAIYNDEGDENNVYLSFKDNTECCICFKTSLGVSFPHCEHYTCIDCHKRCWFGPDSIEIEFPYSDAIKQLYLDDMRNDKWKQDPKMKEYIDQDNKAEYARMDQWEKETNLRKCPLCRQ